MKTRLIVIATLAATFAACSSIPERNTALDQASARFNAARGDPQVSTLARDELMRAGESLGTAEKARAAGGTTAEVDHLAYLANQRVAIARETASSRAAQAVTASAAGERDKMRLALRTREADMAEQQLALAQQANTRKTAELAAADASALRGQARLSDLETQLKDLNAKKTDRGIVVTLGDVLFDSGRSQLLAEGTRSMVKLAEVFRLDPNQSASIQGYTDSVGSAESNMMLSQRRASSVMSALVSLGVPQDRLSTQAHGEDLPTASNDTAAGRQMNRRVEIVFAPPG